MSTRINAEPVAAIELRPEQVKKVVDRVVELTNPDENGNIPVQVMSHQERVELAKVVDDQIDRLFNTNHPKHTRIVAWAQDRGLQFNLYKKALYTLRKRISDWDSEIPARATKQVDYEAVNFLDGFIKG